MKLRGRTKPYTEIGLLRVPCARCGAKPSIYQWNCCANRNRWMGVCAKCDIALNRFCLQFFRFPDWRATLRSYVDRVTAEN